ncbi:hypothetical protein AAC387_Pa03g2438 [Persea americana]
MPAVAPSFRTLTFIVQPSGSQSGLWDQNSSRSSVFLLRPLLDPIVAGNGAGFTLDGIAKMFDSHSSLTTSSASLQIAPPNVAMLVSTGVMSKFLCGGPLKAKEDLII